MRTVHSLDLSGDRFGRLVVVRKAEAKGKRGEIYWLCKCDCGNMKSVRANQLTRGITKSCGCLQRESVKTHGMTGVPTFKSWDSMKQRCLNPNSPDYANYGGRGIKVCEEWVDSFDSFLADMGTRPTGTTLDRIDPNGNYEKANCRWATVKTQNSNKRATKRYAFNGKELTASEISELTGVQQRLIVDRMRAGWKIEDAVNKPNRKSHF